MLKLLDKTIDRLGEVDATANERNGEGDTFHDGQAVSKGIPKFRLEKIVAFNRTNLIKLGGLLKGFLTGFNREIQSSTLP